MTAVDVPRQVRATLADRLFIERDRLPAALVDALRRLAAFANPQLGEREAMRLSTAMTPRLITCFEDLPHHLALPRGCADAVVALLDDLGVTLELADARTLGSPLGVAFGGTLRDEQASTVRDLIAHDIGVLCAPPGAGKTVMGASLIAARARSTLVLVHRKPLVEQWIERLREFLDLGGREVGVIGGGRRKPTGELDVATVQSFARSEIDPTCWPRTGMSSSTSAITCPRSRSSVFSRAARRASSPGSPRRLTAAAAISRSSRCSGPVRHTIDAATDTTLALRVVRRDTPFDPAVLPSDPAIQEIYSALAADDDRTELIVRDTRQLLSDGRVPLVLTERREHLERLAAELTGARPDGRDAARRRHTTATTRSTRPAQRPAGRGAACAGGHGTLHRRGLRRPAARHAAAHDAIAWKGTIVQYAGRLHRSHPGKREACIYDFVDVEVPVLRRMFAKRARSYRAMSYTIDGAWFGAPAHAAHGRKTMPPGKRDSRGAVGAVTQQGQVFGLKSRGRDGNPLMPTRSHSAARGTTSRARDAG